MFADGLAVPATRNTGLTHVNMGKTMRRSVLLQTGATMFRLSTRSYLSLTLLAAMALSSVAAQTRACGGQKIDGTSKQCCGACCVSDELVDSCCSTARRPRVCRCSVENQRPATPRQERRPSDQRDDARRTESTATVIFVGHDESPERFAEDATLFSGLPTSRLQAVLCRWLI